MAFKLIVRQQFLDFEIGDVIGDAADVARYAASHPAFVIKVTAPDTPPPPANK